MCKYNNPNQMCGTMGCGELGGLVVCLSDEITSFVVNECPVQR